MVKSDSLLVLELPKIKGKVNFFLNTYGIGAGSRSEIQLEVGYVSEKIIVDPQHCLVRHYYLCSFKIYSNLQSLNIQKLFPHMSNYCQIIIFYAIFSTTQ